MIFYVIKNGYVGAGYCRVYVAAENDDRAKELASEVFKNHIHGGYPERYYDPSELEIVHRLKGDVEGAIKIVED